MYYSKFFLIIGAAISVFAQAPATPPAHVAVTPGTPSVSAPAAAVPPDKIVLSVGDEKITAGDFDQIVDALPPQVQAQVKGPQKRAFADQLVRVKVLYQEARKQKLDESPRVKVQLELQKENLIANLLMQELTANAQIDDATARQYYEQHKSDYETANARHILIRAKGSPLPVQPGKKELTDEEALAKAQEVRKRILGGEDFAAVAKVESDDVRSGANGGDLGAEKHNQTVPPFDQAMFSLPIGEVSEPVKTQFGYHVIKVEKRDVKPFDEVKPEIEKKLRPELARSAVENLQQKTTVVLDDAFFGPQTTPAPTPTAKPPAPASAPK